MAVAHVHAQTASLTRARACTCTGKGPMVSLADTMVVME
jgi:hypothetical protein